MITIVISRVLEAEPDFLPPAPDDLSLFHENGNFKRTGHELNRPMIMNVARIDMRDV